MTARARTGRALSGRSRGGPASGERRVATVEVVPAVGSRRVAAAALAALVGADLLLSAAALVPAPPVVLVLAAVLVALAELAADRAPVVGWALARVGLGPGSRGLLRGLLLLAYAARTGSGRVVVATAVAVGLVAVAAVLRAAAAQVVAFLRAPPVLARGLRLDVPGVPRALPARLLEPAGLAAAAELPAAVGLAVSARSDDAAALAGLAGTVLLALVPGAVLGLHVLRLRRARVRSRVPQQVQARLRDLRPEVVLYFSGNPTWRYQVEMWLEPVERLGRPALVVVRDREVLAALAPTSLPVVCVPNGSALTSLELPAARLALYVANTGDSMHLLRRRELVSAFIGHGDSDKGASTNPFARVYDEVWTAGQAGRRRFLEAAAGIAPERLVAVGRPQLAPPGPPPSAAGGPVTVLYAPTWEGWGDDPFASSLVVVGPALVRALLARPGVRVLYRPHPLSGSRDAAVRRAGAEVVRLLRAAGTVGPELAPPEPGTAQAAAGDPLDLAIAGGPAWSRAEQSAARVRWAADYWAAAPDAARILSAPAPELHDCFEVADVLVADVSSVTTEWLATGRPYAVVDGAGLGEAAFRAAYPSAAGGVVLSPDDPGPGLAALLAAVAGPDPLAPVRRAVREDLLGPPTPDPLDGFRAAVDRVCASPARAPVASASGPGDGREGAT